jgi:tyrosine-specific transport protein
VNHSDWTYTFAAFPIIFASFAYQGIVPTLSTYLDRDPKKMKKAIWIGTLVPFIVYIIWEVLILGIVPASALSRASSAVEPLSHWLLNPYVDMVGQSFAFFALITSFLGVALGLVDFLADGLSIQKDNRGKFVLGLLVLLPPIFLNIFFGNLFITALGFAGGIGSALLLGLLPIAMVWKGRPKNPQSTYRVKGGRVLLVLLALFGFAELLFELSTILT